MLEHSTAAVMVADLNRNRKLATDWPASARISWWKQQTAANTCRVMTGENQRLQSCNFNSSEETSGGCKRDSQDRTHRDQDTIKTLFIKVE